MFIMFGWSLKNTEVRQIARKFDVKSGWATYKLTQNFYLFYEWFQIRHILFHHSLDSVGCSYRHYRKRKPYRPLCQMLCKLLQMPLFRFCPRSCTSLVCDLRLTWLATFSGLGSRLERPSADAASQDCPLARTCSGGWPASGSWCLEGPAGCSSAKVSLSGLEQTSISQPSIS